MHSICLVHDGTLSLRSSHPQPAIYAALHRSALLHAQSDQPSLGNVPHGLEVALELGSPPGRAGDLDLRSVGRAGGREARFAYVRRRRGEGNAEDALKGVGQGSVLRLTECWYVAKGPAPRDGCFGLGGGDGLPQALG